MLAAILLLSVASVAMVADLTGLFDGDGDDIDDLDQVTEDHLQGLVDEDALDGLRLDLIQDIALADTGTVLDGDVDPGNTSDYAEIVGTDGDDLIQASASSSITFGFEGNDSVLGQDGYDVIFGDQGDDVLFGEGGDDHLDGNEDDDLLSGGDGDDLLVGGFGADTLFGGDGDDTIYDGPAIFDQDEGDALDGISAGAGDDIVTIEDGVNLIVLGEGADVLTSLSETGNPEDRPVSVITDFDVDEDALLIAVHSADSALLSENSQDITFLASEIETELGSGTLIVPAVSDPALAEVLKAEANVPLTILQGVTPDQVDGLDLTVMLIDGDHQSLASDGYTKRVFG